MTLPSLLRRIEKIELSRRPPRGLFFVVFGRAPDEIEAAVEQARGNRSIAHGDQIVRCAWSNSSAVPPGRWVPDTMHALDPCEFEALSGEVDKVEEALRAEAMVDLEEIAEAAAAGGWKERTLTDAALIAPVLATPLSAERASLADDRLLRVARLVAELNPPARRPTKH